MFVDEEKAKAELVAMGLIKKEVLDELEKVALIQDNLGDHYDLSENTRGKIDINRRKIHGIIK